MPMIHFPIRTMVNTSIASGNHAQFKTVMSNFYSSQANGSEDLPSLHAILEAMEKLMETQSGLDMHLDYESASEELLYYSKLHIKEISDKKDVEGSLTIP